MNITTKVSIFFIVALLGSIIAGAFTLITVAQTRANISELEMITEMRTALFNRANLFDEYLLYRTERYSQQWLFSGKQTDELFEEAKKIFNTPDESAILVLMEKSNNDNTQTGIQIFSNFSLKQETILSRKIEVSLVEKLLIERNEMSLHLNDLSSSAGKDISFSQKRLVVSTGLAIGLLLFIIFLNLTWLRKIITKLDESNVRHLALFESIGDGIIGTNLDGKIILINQSAQTMLGRHSESLVGRALLDILPITDEKGNLIPDKEHPVRITLTTGIPTTTTTTGPTYNYVRKDKTKFPVANIVSPVVIDGKTVGTIEVFRDITKEKEIDKAKTEFVSLASHQLRTPLSTVNWYSEMLLTGDVGEISGEQKTYLEEIYKGNQRMVDLVNTLLDVSRIELGTFDGESQPTNIVSLVESVMEEYKLQIDEKKLKLKCVLATHVPLIQVDPKLIRMVIQNLLSNSVKYTQDRGRISVVLSLDDNKNVIINISDTGYGIPKDQQGKIFTKLFRADNVVEKDTEGTGLGLYIAKSIVDQAGGRLWFESEEDKGTTFHLLLPIGKAKKNSVPSMT